MNGNNGVGGPPESDAEGAPSADDETISDFAEQAPAPSPEPVQDLASACVRYVEHALGIRLDGTAETLPILDHYVRQARAEAGIKDKAEVLNMFVGPVGAYFAEVIHRTIPLRWDVGPPTTPRRWRVTVEHVPVSFNPAGAVVEALQVDQADDWGAELQLPPAHRTLAERALDRVPPMSREDYFLLSSRLEALTIVVDALLPAVGG